jgi:thiol-disulfide isomerase/thioredoxin
MKTTISKFILTNLFVFISLISTFANAIGEGYEIKIQLSDYGKDTLFLGYQVGNQSSIYIRDTAILDKSSGFFTFKGEEKLKPGVYLVAMPPDFYFQILINEQEQKFTLVTSVKQPYNKSTLKDSKDNDLFFNYMHYLNDKSKLAEEAKILRSKDSIKATLILQNLDKEVKLYQQNLVAKNVGTMTAMLIKTAIEVDGPIFDHIKDKNERETALYNYYKQHWFDNFDMSNPALLSTPTLFKRIDYYIEKLTPQHPDSLIKSLDTVFELMNPSKETFQFYFLHYYNHYVQSKFVGFDAIHVHLAKKYIETGKTDSFISKNNREKIIDNANKLFPTLIGKKAPEITVYLQDSVFDNNSQAISLYSVKAKYTVIFFYAPDCGHCKKQSPELVAFAKKAMDKKMDIKIFTTCTYLNVNSNKMPECVKYIQEKGFINFINTMDPYLISRYSQLYNVERTPQLFVLDENKIIRSKGIDAAQLEEVINMVIQEDSVKKN